jgi:hypothetical protein
MVADVRNKTNSAPCQKLKSLGATSPQMKITADDLLD